MKNWYKQYNIIKVSNIVNVGEYWIPEYGQPIFADGDVGSENHRTIVIGKILSGHDIDIDAIDIYETTDEEFEERGLTNEEIRLIRDVNHSGAVEYAMKNWNWIAIRRHSVDIWRLDDNSIRRLSRGLSDILEGCGVGDENIDNVKFEIYEYSTGAFLPEVKWADIYFDKINELKMSKHRGLAPKTQIPSYALPVVQKGVGLRDARKYNWYRVINT